MIALASFVCGLLFGIGLIVSGMTQPAKVLGFLDIFGVWDPTLALVMLGALLVSFLGFRLARQQAKPALAAQHLWPTRANVDRSLLIGSALFGIGWGLVGLCPGPALVNLTTLMPQVVVFVLAMVAGLMTKELWERSWAGVGTKEPSIASDG